jgi:hypothetical protein
MVRPVQSRYNRAMSPAAQKLLEEARKLPPDERDWLIGNLLAEEVGTSQEAFDAWQKEVGQPEPGYEEWFRAGVRPWRTPPRAFRTKK